MTFLLSLVKFCVLPMIYFKYPSNHRVITYASQPCLFLLSGQPGTAEEMCECLCSCARALLSVITSECVYPDSCGLMLGFFSGIDYLENFITHLL